MLTLEHLEHEIKNLKLRIDEHEAHITALNKINDLQAQTNKLLSARINQLLVTTNMVKR